MTAHSTHFSHECGIAPQLRAPGGEAAVARKHDARVRAAFWWTAIVVSLLFWAAIAYGISLLSLDILTT
jgi:hypothetical protein